MKVEDALVRLERFLLHRSVGDVGGAPGQHERTHENRPPVFDRKDENLISIRTMSEKETGDVGFKLGRIIKNGDIVCLTGELGAGKTVFVKGIASALNVDEYITSPTFTIVNEYNNGKFPVYHFDVYRISEPDDMYEIGFEEYIYGDGVVVIEWADLIKEILPPEVIWVNIEKSYLNKKDTTGTDIIDTEAYLVLEEGRIINIYFLGEKYKNYADYFTV